MVFVIVALLWTVILTPFAFRSLRRSRAEKSIARFSAEHRTLRDAGYTVQPVRALLDEPEELERSAYPPLRVVQHRDEVGSAEPNRSLDEWARRSGLGERPRPTRSANPYAAYKATPSVTMTTHHDDAPIRRVSMRVRRTRIMAGLLTSAVGLTVGRVATGVSVLQSMAVVAWIALAVFAILALVAISLGYLDARSILPRAPRLATVTPLTPVADDLANTFYDADESDAWRRESARRAIG